ncbi:MULTISPECIES: IclR family transcriptional regulator [Saccharopolyspora]|uniref:IclR family transcriptional regulator n=1 Tax=Saccharopolyspora gregorii TaxID=33914 RepID=A0ABP6RSQ9_9PSEU|nr:MULTISPECIES: IclR family transcriptional regulator [Saccharopolyspora]MCA1187190.1 IclR family transcriptional regulator [Saccharopolyspora sp. 6T]MCA1194312.1 IclR family transcriptional regulator [Saccharopolyspora sp. 6V]MCA1229750.1 IclR family transcriptional regulator [Saccharopolyspora sp. 6M]MCA1282705.1 IclR family transcriptional regulator [Saccharopolyspora sp. 7B]
MSSGATEGSALRTLRVLEAVARTGGPHRLGEIAADTGIAKPSTHRILSGLSGAGYVVSDGDGAYGLGPRAYALSATIASAEDTGGDTVLRRFQSEVQQTVHVALRSGDHAIYVRKVDSPGPYRMASRIGGVLPLHCTAIGKAVLAHLPADERAPLLRDLTARTERTTTDPAVLEQELARVRADGCALDDEENEPTIRCLAAPMLDRAGRPVGGVSISTITFQTPKEALLAHADRLVETAALLAPLYT